MTDVYLDDYGLYSAGNFDNRWNSPYFSKITIRAVSVAASLEKKLKITDRPFVYTVTTNPVTYAIDMKQVVRKYAIAGYIDSTSLTTGTNDPDFDNHSTPDDLSTVRNTLVRSIFAGGVLRFRYTHNYDTNVDVAVQNCVITEDASDEDIPTKFKVTLNLIECELRTGD